MRKRGSATEAMLWQGIGIFIFILIFLGVGNAVSKIFSGTSTDLVEDYINDFIDLVEETASLEVGESIRKHLVIPQNSAIFVFNPRQEFMINGTRDRADSGTTREENFELVMQRPEMCLPSYSCICYCEGFESIGTRNQLGSCQAHTCFDARDIITEDSVRLDSVLEIVDRTRTSSNLQSAAGTIYEEREENMFWNNGLALIRSQGLSSGGASTSALQLPSNHAGYSYTLPQDFEVTMKKVGETAENVSIIRLCLKEEC